MDTLKRLRLEFNVIEGIINSYTSNPNVTCYLQEMKSAINNKDVEAISFCLENIADWYRDSIGEITANIFVDKSDIRGHHDNIKRINDYIAEFKEYSLPQNDSETLSEITSASVEPSNPIIFISHKSNDVKYGNALREFIIGLGVDCKQLIYTSHPVHTIPLDVNIYDYLRNNIKKDVFMIILWSNTYIESPACLNEMGAAWVIQTDYTNIYTPDFDFGNPKYHECAVDTRKMGAILDGSPNCRTSMIDLKNKIQDMFGLVDDEKTSAYLLDKFIQEITAKDKVASVRVEGSTLIIE